MHVLGHDHDSVQPVSVPMVVTAMLQNEIASFRAKRLSRKLAQRDEQRSSAFLIGGKLAAIVILSLENQRRRRRCRCISFLSGSIRSDASVCDR